MKKIVTFLGLFLFILTASFAQSYYITQNANLRGGPSSNNGVIAVLSAGTEIELLSSNQVNGFYHIKVKSSGKEGYVHNSLISSNRSNIPRYSASEYVDLWSGNKLQAELLYKGKRMEITGIVLRVGRKLFTNEPYVDLDTDNPIENLFGGVTCEFPESAINSIASLQIGQTVTIIGYAENTYSLLRCSITR